MATIEAVTARVRPVDTDGRTGTTDLTIASNLVTVDAALLTAIDGFVTDNFGDTDGSKFLHAGLESFQLVVDITPATLPTATLGDIRAGWQVTFPSGVRRTFGGRSTAGPLTTADSGGAIADKSNAAVATFLERMFNDPGDATTPGLGVVDPENGTNPFVADIGILAKTSRRQLPRVGGNTNS